MAVKARASITLTFVVDIQATYRYYKLQSSTSSAPSVPTTKPPSGWTATEPSYTSGSTNTLYFVDLTVFTNGEFSYSEVSVSSSYEAAKEAFNKAASAETAAANAAKTATNFLYHDTTDGLQVGNRSSGSWAGTRARMKSDAFEIVSQDGTVLASYGLDTIEFAEQVTFKADGIKLDNGDAFTELGKNNVLWSHATGYYMNASHVLSLSSNISRQLSGAVFCWAKYGTSSEWLYFFVPKTHVANHGGATVRMSDAFLGVAKYLYVSNGQVTGVASNQGSGTMNGIAYNNSNYVLRYIIGV